jgi:hypothetical protein
MSDKRSVATDALETLGTIIGDGAGRDAIHLAVEPVVASERLLAGQDVYLLPDGRAAKGKDNAVGIVDPFLRQSVKEGGKFWLVVYPRQITSLRHVWSHPAFPEEPHPAFHEEEVESELTEADKEKARHVAERLTNTGERWLRDWCAKNDVPDYETVMKAIKDGSANWGDDDDNYGGHITVHDDHIYVGGRDAHASIPSEFWDHVEAVTGRKQVLRPTYFSCSC